MTPWNSVVQSFHLRDGRLGPQRVRGMPSRDPAGGGLWGSQTKPNVSLLLSLSLSIIRIYGSNAVIGTMGQTWTSKAHSLDTRNIRLNFILFQCSSNSLFLSSIFLKELKNGGEQHFRQLLTEVSPSKSIFISRFQSPGFTPVFK